HHGAMPRPSLALSSTGRTIMYVSTPSNGKKITKTIQPAFDQPDRSGRRKTSERTRISSQIQITKAKKMNIVQTTSRNGSLLASAKAHLFPGRVLVATLASDRGDRRPIRVMHAEPFCERVVGDVALARLLGLTGAARGAALRPQELADRPEPPFATRSRGNEWRRFRRRLVRLRGHPGRLSQH